MQILSWNRSDRYLWRNASLNFSLKIPSADQSQKSTVILVLAKVCIIQMDNAKKNEQSKQKLCH